MSRAESQHCTVVITGVGSPFGADRLGWLAIDGLEQSNLRDHVPDLRLNFAQADRPGALLLEQLRGVDAAIIIDAMQTGSPPGTLRTFTPEQLLTQNTGLLSSHAFGVVEAVSLGFTLGELPMQLSIIGIEVGNDVNEVLLPDRTRHELLWVVEDILISVKRAAGTS